MPRVNRYSVESTPAPGAVVAAAKNFKVGKARRGWVGSEGQRQDDDWQNVAWDMYDLIGEFRYAVDWVGNQLSKAKLFVSKDGEHATDPRALDAMASLFGGEEGQSEMLRQCGIHFTVAGEAYLVGLEGADPYSDDDWWVIASTEISRDGTNRFKIGKGSDAILVEKGKSVVIRIWRPHPRKPRRATSPSRAALPILAELDMLTRYVAAQGDSRLTSAGVWLLPSQISFPTKPTTAKDPSDPNAEVSTSTSTDATSLAKLLTEVASIAIQHPEDAAAKVPIILQVDGEYLDKSQHMTFWSDFDEQTQALRKEAIGRLGLSLDMPPEILTGTADVNHWGSWAIEEATVKSHTEPLLSVITSSLTVGYLRPFLIAEGMSEEEADAYVVDADTSELRLRPNRSEQAFELYDRGVLREDALRRENGFTDSDAPTSEDRAKWLTWKMAQGQTTPELVAEAARLSGVRLSMPAGEPIETAPAVHEARPVRSLKDHPRQDPPNNGVAPEMVASCEGLVFRAMERAGNRLKTRIRGGVPADVDAIDLYRSVPALSAADLDFILSDAWSYIDRYNVGLPTPALEACLNNYVRVTLAKQRPYSREALVQHLQVMVAETHNLALLEA